MTHIAVLGRRRRKAAIIAPGVQGSFFGNRFFGARFFGNRFFW